MSIDLPVSDFMARELLECSPATPVGEAAALMRTARCGSILVVEQGRAVGIWTETDALSGNWQSIGDLEQPVSLFMSSPVKTMRVGTSPSIRMIPSVNRTCPGLRRVISPVRRHGRMPANRHSAKNGTAAG